jgi:hypothetical protein
MAGLAAELLEPARSRPSRTGPGGLRCALWRGFQYADAMTLRRVYPSVSREDLDVPRRERPPK